MKVLVVSIRHSDTLLINKTTLCLNCFDFYIEIFRFIFDFKIVILPIIKKKKKYVSSRNSDSDERGINRKWF